MERFVALLRGINVGGHRTIPMAALREAAEKSGLSDVATYIQSGNLVFGGEGSAVAIEEELEALIAKRFGHAVDVVARTSKQWRAHAAGNPFAAASEAAPQQVMMLLAKAHAIQTHHALDAAVAALRDRAAHGEVVEAAGDALWIHYPHGAGTSKLSPALIDRLVGAPVTARNWRTVVKLQQMVDAA